MTRRGQRRQKNDEPEVEPEVETPEVDESFQQFSSHQVPDPGYRDRLNQFLALAQHNASKATFYIYRLNGRKRSQLGRWVNESELPDTHEAGLKWGSGDYDIVMTAPPLRAGGKSIIVSYPFTIDPYYDELRVEEMRKNPYAMMAFPGQMQQPPQQDSGKNFMDAITLLQGLIGTLAPLMRPADANPDMSKHFQTNFRMLNDVMKRSMEDNIELFGDYQRKILMLKDRNLDDSDEVAPGETESVIEKIVPYLKDWLPLLVGGGQPAKAVAGTVKKTQMYKEIVKSKALTKGLIEFLDKDKGREETDKVLLALGVKRMAKK